MQVLVLEPSKFTVIEHVQKHRFTQPLFNPKYCHPEVCTWCGYTVNGVAQIGHKEKPSLRMLLVLILLLHATMRLIALADRTTKIARREDAHDVEMTNL